MLLEDFNIFFLMKLIRKMMHKRWITINNFVNPNKDKNVRMCIEITEDKHSLMKNYCKHEGIDMKDFLWLVIEKGFEGAKEHIKDLKSKINSSQNNTKKKIFWIF